MKHPALHPAAVPAALPQTLVPQLVTLAKSAPTNPDDWIYEIKYDGFRIATRVQGTSVKLFTRNGHNWTSDLECVRRAIARLCLPDGWYDGEIVVLNERGLPDFGLLQQSIDARRSERITYFLFDCPYLMGHDLRAVPLEARRALLQAVLPRVRQAAVCYSMPLTGDPQALLAAACELGLEGIVAKRRDAQYVSRRARSWIKLKCTNVDEFIIGGYTRNRAGVACVLLGEQLGDGRLRYVGSAGTGLTDAERAHLLKAFEQIPALASPFSGPVGRYRWARWVRPVLRAQVSFTEWTEAKALRHPVLKGFGLAEP